MRVGIDGELRDRQELIRRDEPFGVFIELTKPLIQRNDLLLRNCQFTKQLDYIEETRTL